MKKRWGLRRTEGQSLVEMALALPLLLLMFAGLIEVGAALRNYLVVVNANREGTRFAARGRWFDSEEEVNYIFERVVAAAGTERRSDETVPFLRTEDRGEDLPANTGIAVTYIRVSDQLEIPADMDCDVPYPCFEYSCWAVGSASCEDSEIDPGAIGQEAADENREFNETYYLGEDPDSHIDSPSDNDFVVVEVWYRHEQLLKLPFFTELLPEEFTLYAQTRMRVTISRFEDEVPEQ